MASKKAYTVFLAAFCMLAIANQAFAQSKQVQRALEDVKDGVLELTSSKEESEQSDLSIRIETFKKIIDLSLTEAKDLKNKLLIVQSMNEAETTWKGSALQQLGSAIAYLEEVKKQLTETEPRNLAAVKESARQFKTWREEHYTSAIREVNDFLLVQAEQKAIDTTKKRWQKIKEDVAKIQKAKVKNAGVLSELLREAGTKIQTGEALNQKAYDLFYARSVAPLLATSSSPETPTEAFMLPEPTASSSATSSAPSPSSPTMSITDLVTASFDNVREAYQIFIEMSSLVRKLFR